MPYSKASNLENPKINQSLTKVASGSLIIMLGLVLGAMLQYGYNLGLARVFGAKLTGDFVFCLSIVSIAAVIGQLGAQELLLRYIAAYRGSSEQAKLRSVILVGITLGLLGSLSAALLVYASAPWISSLARKPELEDLLHTMCWFIPLLAAITLSANALQSAKRMGRVISLREIGRPFAIVVALLAAWLFSISFGQFVWLINVVLLGIVSLAARFLWSEFRDARTVTGDRENTWMWIGFSMSVVFMDLFRATTGWLDTLILGFYVPSEEIALYFAAIRTALLITIVLGACNAVLSPMAADLWHRKDITGLDAAFKLTTRWTALAILPIALSMFLVSDELMALFGPDYVAAKPILVTIIIGRTVNGLTGGVTRLLIMTGHQRVELMNTMVTTIAMIGGMSWAAQSYGMLGVAIVSSAVVIMMNIVKLLEVRWLIGIQPYDARYLKLVAAASVALIAGTLAQIYGTDFSVIAKLITVPLCTALSYTLVWYLLGIEDEERAIVARLPWLQGKLLLTNGKSWVQTKLHTSK
ncbi:MAG: oligosaccharide flippase family protein [Chloroflexota bacterium]